MFQKYFSLKSIEILLLSSIEIDIYNVVIWLIQQFPSLVISLSFIVLCMMNWYP